MLCENIFGWKEASQIAEKKNHSLRDRLESALSESGGRELTD
jgi:hypothetical protein